MNFRESSGVFQFLFYTTCSGMNLQLDRVHWDDCCHGVCHLSSRLISRCVQLTHAPNSV